MSEYINYFLRFEDQAEMETAYRPSSEEGDGLTYPGCFVDVVGQIVATPAEMDEDGNEITPAIFASGWHVNVATKGDLPAALVGFAIDAPATPARVWA